jgi:octaprenyl-diphosphate synthase
VDEVINLVQNSGGITYATQKMHEYKEEALSLLHQYPDSPARQAMEDLVHYAIDRKY